MDREFGEDTPQMTFVDWDQVVEALAADGSDQAFAECIRRRRSYQRLQGSHPEALQFLIHTG
jgi:hypothetical protein